MCSHIEYEEDFEADDEGPVEDGDEAEEKLASAATGEEKETETRDENDINEEKSNSDSDDTNMSSKCYFFTLFSNMSRLLNT